jgi:hypothetical protein
MNEKEYLKECGKRTKFLREAKLRRKIDAVQGQYYSRNDRRLTSKHPRFIGEATKKVGTAVKHNLWVGVPYIKAKR